MRLSLFMNDYTKIRVSNHEEGIKLSTENWDAVNRMMEYISGSNISMFEIEVLRKDLIGLAREAEAEEISLQEKLGMTEKEFCDSLLEGAMEKKPYEPILTLLPASVFAVASLNTLYFWLEGCPEEYGLSLHLVVFFLLVFTVDAVIEKVWMKKLTYSKYKSYATKADFVISCGLTYWMMSDEYFNKFMLFKMNGWAIAIILFVLALLAYLAKNRYWNLQSMKYNWK